MLEISEDINSLSSFKRNSAEFIDRLKQTGRPVVLTVKGKVEVIVQDAESYQRLLDLLDLAEAVVGVRKGLDSIERGEGIPAEEAFQQLRKKYNIPQDA